MMEKTAWVQIWVLLFTNCVTLYQYLNFSGFQVSQIKNETKNVCFET